MSSQPSDSLFRAGAGELASLVREKDWSKTSLGPAEQWPQSLRTVLNILLSSRYAMWMAWGPDLTFLYNDAYRPTLGIKHPWALGTPAPQVWAEIWNDIGPRIERVMTTGESAYEQGLLLILQRSGFPEETYHTFSYSPLLDDSGRASGMLCVVTEETERVINERRMSTLREFASALSGSKMEHEVLEVIEQQFTKSPKDLPFTLTYLFDASGNARLARSTGISASHPAAAELIPSNSNRPWPASALFAKPSARVIDISGARGHVGAHNHDEDAPLPKKAFVVPIRQQGQKSPAGFLAVAANPYRHCDDAYAGFIDLLAGQIAAGLASANAYQEERRRAEALAELDRAKTLFFSNVSHEFRTPLTLMLGPVEDLLSGTGLPAGAEQAQLLKVVQRNGLRLQKLVNSLLDFSRIEAGRSDASYQPTDLASFTAELASSFHSAMQRANLAYTVECAPLSDQIYIDRDMWEKVVLNLISNAFKYTLAGSIRVRLVERGGFAEFSVADTGIGISKDELPHIFERFHRVEGTRGRTQEGTGIGLALVQELVKLHAGTVIAESTFGEGSTFTVRLAFGAAHLPKERVGANRGLNSTAVRANAYVEEALRWLPGDNGPGQERMPARAIAPPANGSAGPLGLVRRGRVLLADDNADMRVYLKRLLSPHYEVTAVADGEEALAAALAQPPDLILTDVMMPNLDGIGLCERIRANPGTASLPVILVTSLDEPAHRARGLEAGADAYVAKSSFDQDALLDTVRLLIGRQDDAP